MGFLPFAYLMFFPFLDFSCSFSRMTDNNDVMVTCFIKMAVLLFTKGFSYFTSIKPDSTLSSEKKNYFVVFFYVKIKVSCPRTEQEFCAFGVLQICLNSYFILIRDRYP